MRSTSACEFIVILNDGELVVEAHCRTYKCLLFVVERTTQVDPLWQKGPEVEAFTVQVMGTVRRHTHTMHLTWRRLNPAGVPKDMPVVASCGQLQSDSQVEDMWPDLTWLSLTSLLMAGSSPSDSRFILWEQVTFGWKFYCCDTDWTPAMCFFSGCVTSVGVVASVILIHIIYVFWFCFYSDVYISWLLVRKCKTHNYIDCTFQSSQSVSRQ